MTILSTHRVDNILGSRKYSFSAPRRPFRMTGYVFNAYGSRAIDSALFYNSISRGSSSKDIESNVVTTFDVVKPFLLIRRKWASATDVSKHWSELPNCSKWFDSTLSPIPCAAMFWSVVFANSPSQIMRIRSLSISTH